MRKAALLLSLALASAAFGKSLERKAAARPEPSNGPVMKGLKIHEWGVFLVGKKDATRASAGGEPPTFVQRVEMPGKPPAPTGGGCAEKPVLHVYAPKPLSLEVHVAFPGGMPKLAWPRGTPEWRGSPEEPVPGLSWTLQVGGEGEPRPPKVPDGHWIAAGRKSGSDLVRAGQDAERFLFYEGDVDPIRQKPSVGRNADGYTLDSDRIDQAWVVESAQDGLSVLHEIGMIRDPGDNARRPPRAARPCAPELLREDLAKALTTSGLSTAESAAVLDIWMPELVRPGKRLVYVLPLAEYDRLLPITFDPAPEELKRVGLVIQELAP